MSTHTVYDVRTASKVFGNGATRVVAVNDATLQITPGEFVALVGTSGSGKTTLLQLLGGLDRATSGEVVFDGDDLAHLGDRKLAELRLRSIGFVFQQFNLIPTLTAAQNVEAAMAPADGVDHARVAELLDSVGLAHRANHLPGQLSGGEQQRVAIARALANNPRVLLADEPTGNLDSATGNDILTLLEGLSRDRGLTILLITHDEAVAQRADRTLHMADGQLNAGQ